MPKKTVYKSKAIQNLSILDQDGKVDTKLEPKVDDDTLVRLYETMVTSRHYDERRMKLQRQGRIGTFAPAFWQEAAQAGSISQIEEDDWFVPSFREVTCSLWRGAALENDLLWTAGFEEGMVIGDRDLPVCIPIGTQYTHALGVAWAEKLKGSDRVAIVYGGDGSTSEGDFHEAINMAAVMEVPVVFFIQNNQWAISVPREKQTRSKTLAQKAIAYEVPSIQVDGQDALAALQATRDAVKHCRSGKGPFFIEAVTFRMGVHTTADDPSKYRSKEVEKEWEPKDPLIRFRKYLEAKDLWDDDKEETLLENVKERIDTAVSTFEERKKELEHDVLGMFNHAYASGLPPYVERQMEAMREHFEAVGGAKTEQELHDESYKLEDLAKHYAGGV